MKITALTMLVGVLAIAGIPLFSGWYSKDAILAQALGFVMVHHEHILLFLLPLVTAGITTFYMFRMWFMTFTGKPRDEHVYEHAHESPWLMTVPLIVLAVLQRRASPGAGRSGTPRRAAWKQHLHHAQPPSVQADFGCAASRRAVGRAARRTTSRTAATPRQYHALAGYLALLAWCLRLRLRLRSSTDATGVLDPAEAKEQFPGVHPSCGTSGTSTSCTASCWCGRRWWWPAGAAGSTPT